MLLKKRKKISSNIEIFYYNNIFAFCFSFHTLLYKFYSLSLAFLMSLELITWIKKILILIIILAIGYLLYLIESLIVVLLISSFITILIAPLIDIMEKRRIHASITII